MTENNELEFKVGIVGPTRVGKTSLIAAILEDSERLLQGTPLKMSPRNTKTERRIAQHHNELRGFLKTNEFNPGSVKGTQEAFEFDLKLDPGVESIGINLSFLDYPGGWFNPSTRPPEREKEWDECKEWFNESTVLLIPVESAVLMEAVSSEAKQATPGILTTYEIRCISAAWAKARNDRPHEPALLVFCPVKCESYFADNGGSRNGSLELFDAVREEYKEVIQHVRKDAKHVKVLYAPVDTVGCVEIIEAYWRANDGIPGNLEFSADYRVRPPGERRVKGADAVLISLCRQLMDVQRKIQAQVAEDLKGKANSAAYTAEKDYGLFRNVLMWATRKRQRLRVMAETAGHDADRQRKLVEVLDNTIESLANRKFGARVRENEL